MANKPTMYPDVFRMLIENVPNISQEDAMTYSKKIASLFAEYREEFDNNVFFMFRNMHVSQLYRGALRMIVDELSRRY